MIKPYGDYSLLMKLKDKIDPSDYRKIMQNPHLLEQILSKYIDEKNDIISETTETKTIVKTSQIIKKGIQQYQEKENTRILSDLLIEVKKLRKEVNKMQLTQKMNYISNFLIDFQKTIKETIEKYPNILEIYLEENQSSQITVYFLIADNSYKQLKEIADYEIDLSNQYGDDITEFKVINVLERETFTKGNLIRII